MLKSKKKRPANYHKALRKYWRSYYNENMLRNYRFLYDKTQSFMKDGKRIEYEATSLKASKYVEDDSLTKAPQWLLDKSATKYGTLAGEISYYKTLEDFKNGSLENRFCDRLFYDFDIDDNMQVKELKAEFKKANVELKGRNYHNKYVELQTRFKELIFEHDLLQSVFNEAKSLTHHLQRYGLKPFFVFSGSKGFHVNVFFDEMQLTNLSEISKSLANSYSKELGLHYLDYNVFERTRAHKRLQRIQYATHSKTGLITRPLDPAITYDEMLEAITNKSRRPVDFNFTDHVAPAGFNRMLMKLDKEISFKKAERQKRLERENREKRIQMQKKYGKNYKSFNDIDLRDIASAYGIDGKRQGDKTIVNCPFHNDVHPSAVIYKERFYCSTCAMSLNYYEFISRLEGTTDKGEILDKAREFLRGENP